MRTDRWDQLMGEAPRTGYAPDTTGIAGNPRVRWSLDGERSFTAAPVVSGSRVYAAGKDEHLYAVDRDTGELLWSLEVGEKVHATPAVGRDIVVTKGLSGTLVGVDEESGDVRWQRSVGSGRDAPAAADGTVYVCGREAPVYALDVADGSIEWSSQALAVAATPAVRDGTVVLAGGTQTVALDADTGDVVWKRDVGGVDSGTPPAIAHGRVYSLCEDDSCRSLRVGSGETVWSTDLSHIEYYATVSLPLAVDGSYVYVGHFPRTVTALDAGTGDTVWTTELGTGDTATKAALAVTDDELYAVETETGVLSALDTDGKLRWSFEVPSDALSPPAVVDETLYVGCYDGSVAAIEGE